MRHGVPRLFGRRDRSSDVGAWTDHGELFTAVAEDLPSITHRCAQRGREHLQHTVADGMPVGIVERLEMVDVDKEDAEGTARSRRAEALGDTRIKRSAVQGPGQRVGIDLIDELFGPLLRSAA